MIIKKIILVTLLIPTVLITALTDDAGAYEHIDQLRQSIAIANPDVHQLALLDSIALLSTNVDSIEKYATLEFNLASSLNNFPYRANAMRHLSWAYLYKNNIDRAYEQASRALEIYTSLGDTLNQAYCCAMLGNIQVSRGSSGTADGFYNRSLELYKQIGLRTAEADVYRSMGWLCLVYKVYDRAYEYFGKALDIDTQTENMQGICTDRYNIGYGQLSQCIDENGSQTQFLRAKSDLLWAYSTATEHSDDAYVMIIGCALADAYLYQLKIDEQSPRRQLLDSCLMYINNGYSKMDMLGTVSYRPHFDLRKSRYLLACGDYVASLRMMQNLEDSCNANRANQLMLDEVYQAIIEFYVQTGNYKMAFNYSKKLSDLNRRRSTDGYLVNSTQTKIQIEYDEELRERDELESQREMAYKARSARLVQLIIFIVLVLILMSLLVVVVYRNSRARRLSNEQLDRQNKQLERQQQEFFEQNQQLNQKTEEILAQRDEIEGQRNYLSLQNKLIRDANKQITDSILYAKRIQEAAVPSDELMSSIFGNCLVFWQPRNIVSGDFYWATQVDGYKLIAVADCTGHGVPGAFMSMLGISMLNDIVNSANIRSTTAAAILDELRARLKKSLRQTGKLGESDDGIDLAFCIFDSDERRVQYAGAFRPLIIIRSGELIEYKADKMPCGVYINESSNFTNNIIDLQTGDVLYMYSDGIADQFSGGKAMRKFTIKRVKQMLTDIYSKPFDLQKRLIEKTLDDWRKPESGLGKPAEQVDDILLVGLRI